MLINSLLDQRKYFIYADVRSPLLDISLATYQTRLNVPPIRNLLIKDSAAALSAHHNG